MLGAPFRPLLHRFATRKKRNVANSFIKRILATADWGSKYAQQWMSIILNRSIVRSRTRSTCQVLEFARRDAV
jgi:hypothetical protein